MDEREKAAKANRERLPCFAAWLDTIRAFDPGARVLWARDGEAEVGAVPGGLEC
jgi:hypothetical protein